jgi:small subunit ribosomal protein S11
MVEEITTTPKPIVKARKKQHQSVPAGQLHVQATFNNTIVAFADKKGNVLTTSSAGANGFRGSKKGTAYASQIAAEKVAEIAKTTYGAKAVDVFVKGVGLGRDAAIRAMGSYEISVDSIKDVTAMSHGGVRPRRARRA